MPAGRTHDARCQEALLPYGDKAPWLIGVTVLTSMEQSDMAPWVWM